MNLKYDGPLSNFAFNCNLRPSTEVAQRGELFHSEAFTDQVGALQLDPGLPQLTPSLLSSVETKM